MAITLQFNECFVLAGFRYEDGVRLRAEFRAEEVWRAPEGLIIGRCSDEAHLLLECETISRLHARIGIAEGILFIEDLGSANGTWIEGELLEPQVMYTLELDAHLHLGGAEVGFHRLSRGTEDTRQSITGS